MASDLCPVVRDLSACQKVVSISDDLLATKLRHSIKVQNDRRSKDSTRPFYSITTVPIVPTPSASQERSINAVGCSDCNKNQSSTGIGAVELAQMMERSITVQRQLKSRRSLAVDTDVPPHLPTLSLQSTTIEHADTSCSPVSVHLFTQLDPDAVRDLDEGIEGRLDNDNESSLDIDCNDDDQLEIVPLNQSIGRKRVLCEVLEDSSTPKKKKRCFGDLKFNALQYESCQAVIEYICPCGSNGSSCLKSFKTAGDVLNARIEHYNRSPKEEYQLRVHEVCEAIKFQKPNEKAYVAVTLLYGQKYKLCLHSYAVLYGLPATSFWRTVGQIRNHNSFPTSIGRPHRSNETQDPIVSTAAEECIEWIRNWVVLLSDESPTGDDWDRAIDPLDIKEVYEEYDVWFKAFHFTLAAKPLSFSTSTNIWKYWLKVDRIKIRNKSQTTTKCSKCEDLRCRARSIGVTTKELNVIKAERKKHREDIRALRERYQADVQRASHDPTYANHI